MNDRTKVFIFTGVAFSVWLLMHAYSVCAEYNLSANNQVEHPALAIRILKSIDFYVMGLPIATFCLALTMKRQTKLLDVSYHCLLVFALLWPLLVLVAWQIQSMPIKGLQ